MGRDEVEHPNNFANDWQLDSANPNPIREIFSKLIFRPVIISKEYIHDKFKIRDVYHRVLAKEQSVISVLNMVNVAGDARGTDTRGEPISCY